MRGTGPSVSIGSEYKADNKGEAINARDGVGRQNPMGIFYKEDKPTSEDREADTTVPLVGILTRAPDLTNLCKICNLLTRGLAVVILEC